MIDPATWGPVDPVSLRRYWEFMLHERQHGRQGIPRRD